MNNVVATAVIPVMVAIVAVILTYVFTLWREREADWRKVKLEFYKEFMIAFARNVEGRATREDIIRYHDALNTIALVASPKVMQALNDISDENSFMNPNRSQFRHDKLLNDPLKAMREDISPRLSRNGELPEFKLRAPPPAEHLPSPSTVAGP
jgi:hypothetical protein